MKDNEILKEFSNGEFLISTDKRKIDVQAVYQYLSEESYWAKYIPFETVQLSLENSVCIVACLPDGRLAGFARLITDKATFAYLCDVFVLEEYRGKGISKSMMNMVDELANEFQLRRLLLVTQDAHGLYRQHGFETYPFPEKMMNRKGVEYKAPNL